MEPRSICLIVCGCIIFIAVTLILIRYFNRNKKTKVKEKVLERKDKITNLSQAIQDNNKD